MKAILLWVALTIARSLALAITMLGGWMLVTNLADPPATTSAIRAWILSSGALGAAGGLAYLLSFDGPARLRSRWVRAIGWLGMIISVLLPTSFSFVLVPLVVLVLPTLFLNPQPAPGPGETVTSD